MRAELIHGLHVAGRYAGMVNKGEGSESALVWAASIGLPKWEHLSTRKSDDRTTKSNIRSSEDAGASIWGTGVNEGWVTIGIAACARDSSTLGECSPAGRSPSQLTPGGPAGRPALGLHADGGIFAQRGFQGANLESWGRELVGGFTFNDLA